jgi:YVTN family beta-propeller protein
MSRTPNPNEFLVFPIVDLDLMVFYRGSDISRPLYVQYSKFIAFITANITPASALLLQTNGTDNGSQVLLNLIQGSGITIADNGSGGITITNTSSISGTPTRIPFFDSVSSLADDSNLYWDNVNKVLCVGAAASPSGAARLYLFSSTNNADVFIETIFNQRLKFKNSNSGVQWHTSTNVFEDTPGTPRDSFNIGQSSNPALGYLEILKSGRVKIGGNIAGTLGFTDTVMIELGLTGVRSGAMLLRGVTAGGVILKANDSTTDYVLSFPADAGSSGEVLKTNGAGVTYWDTGGGSGSQLNETTGILYGGDLSAAIGGTTFDLAEGIGQIVSQTSSISGVSTTITPVTWSTSTGIAITNIATHQFTYILIDSSGTIVQQTTPFTDAQEKTHIIIGILCHIDFASVNLVTNAQNVAYEDPHRLVELISAFGPIKKTGLNISANGPNLRVDRASGEAFKIGANYITDQFEPDVATISAQTPVKLCRVHRDGSGGFIFDTFGGVYYDDIDPNQYDDGSGTLAPVPSNRWTIQRLFFFPNNPNDIICYYGVQLYNNFSEARANLEFETFDEATITAENAVFLGFLFVRHNATDLTDPTFAAFLQSGLFRGIPPGGGGSGGGGTVLSQNSITGDGTLGSELELVNDVASPGVLRVYGTDVAGNKGWQTRQTFIPDIAIYPYNEASLISDINPIALSFFPTLNILAIPANGSGGVKLYNSTTNELLANIGLANAVNAFHIPAINEIWVSVLSTSTISRYDDSSYTLIATFSNGGNRATEGVIDPVSGYMYWTNLGSNSISVVNPATLSVVTTFASGTIGGTVPKGICYNDNPLSAMYQMIVAVVSGTSELCIIDPATNTVTAANLNPSSSLSSPQYIRYNATLDRYYVSNSASNNIVVLEPTSATAFSLDTIIKGTVSAYGLEIEESLGLLYVSGGQVSGGVNAPNPVLVYVIDTSTNKIIRVVISASMNTSSAGVYNGAIDLANGYYYCNGYGGSTNRSITTKLKIKP